MGAIFFLLLNYFFSESLLNRISFCFIHLMILDSVGINKISEEMCAVGYGNDNSQRHSERYGYKRDADSR